MRPTRLSAALLLALAACSDSTGPAPKNDYAPAVLAGVPGTDSWAAAINRSGQVTGSYGLNGAERAYRLNGSQLEDLRAVGGGTLRGTGLAINNDGWVVGGSEKVDGWERATLWRPGKPPLDIGPAQWEHQARAVNAKGEVLVVTSLDASTFRFHNYRWTLAGGLRELPLPPTATNAEALAMNAGGVVAGTYAVAGITSSRPVVWSAANLTTDLPLQGSEWGWVHGISDAGVVLGEVDQEGPSRAAAWVPVAGGGYQLKLLPLSQDLAQLSSAATHANARGGIVGFAGPFALYWASADAVPVRLAASAGMYVALPNGINESGHIVGWSGAPGQSTYQATIWRP